MIQRVVSSWLRAVEGTTLTDSFSSAWANIVNALEGSWGKINWVVNGSTEITAMVSRGEWVAKWDTTISGSQTLTLPCECVGFASIVAYPLSGIPSVFLVPQGDLTATIVIPSGTRQIVLSGTARRL